MQIIKPLQLSLLNRSFAYQRKFYLSVGALYGFELTSGKSLLEQDVWEKIAECEELKLLDAALPKHQAEFLVYGCAETPAGEPKKELAVDIQVGPLKKSLLALGKGYWRGLPGFKKQSIEEAFTRLPLTAAFAYGGEDYELNPEGQGHQKVKTPEDEEAYPVTQLQQLKKPATDPGKPLEQAFTSALDFMAEQRKPYAGTYDEAYQAEAMPGLPDDFDFRFCQDALPDQQFASQYLPASLEYRLQNLNAEYPVIKGKLPTWKVVASYLQKKNRQDTIEEGHLDLHPETVYFLPNQNLGLILYRGQLQVERDDARDITALQLAIENPSDPRSKAYYLDQLNKRSDQKNAWRYLMDTQPLLPAQLTCGMALLLETTGEAPNIDMPIKEKAENLAEQTLQEEKQKWVEAQANVDLPDFQVPEVAPPQWQQELEALLERMLPKKPDGNLDISKIDFDAFDELRELNNKIQAEQKAQAIAAALPPLQALLKDPVLKDQHAQIQKSIDDLLNPPLPPWPRPGLESTIVGVDAELKQLKEDLNNLDKQLAPDHLERLNQQFVDSFAQLEDVKDKLYLAEEQIFESYRMGAEHLEGGSPVHSLEALQKAQTEVIQAIEKGLPLPTRDLANMDLSNRILKGVDFSDCYMEAVQLSGSNLSQANLSGAILTHTELEEVDFSQACLDNANLGASSLQNCNFSGANLHKINFNRSRLTQVNFKDARLDESQWMTTEVSRCNFTKASLRQLNLIEPRWEECDFTGCDLGQGNFLNAEFSGCKFDSGKAEGTNFVEVVAENTSFKAVQFNNARFVGGCQLNGSDFSGASLQMASFREASVKKSRFDRANLQQVDLELGDFTGSSFERANLYRANLANVNFTACALEDANLMEASLYHARVVQANLRGANLYAANFLYMEYGETRFDGANLDRTLLQDWRPPA